MFLDGEWLDTEIITGQKYICGHCGTETGSSGGYTLEYFDPHFGKVNAGYILICTTCNFPTFKNDSKQVPHPKTVITVEHLPESLEKLFLETRDTISSGLFNSTVLLCRKMLMNLAVQEGADENKNFAYYVDYIENNGLITNKMKPWVDRIRLIGNTATHEIPDVSQDDAQLSFDFLVMLLKLVYEFPNKMQPNS